MILVYLATALLPSDTACLANSLHSRRLIFHLFNVVPKEDKTSGTVEFEREISNVAVRYLSVTSKFDDWRWWFVGTSFAAPATPQKWTQAWLRITPMLTIKRRRELCSTLTDQILVLVPSHLGLNRCAFVRAIPAVSSHSLRHYYTFCPSIMSSYASVFLITGLTLACLFLAWKTNLSLHFEKVYLLLDSP